MSLQVWLPLNGSYVNHGLDASVTLSGTPSYHENGKIGKGINLSAAQVSGNSSKLKNVKTFSIAFWVIAYEDSSSTNQWNQCFQVGTYMPDGNTGSNFRFESCYGSNVRACSWHNNASYSICTGSRILIQNKNEWHHVCVVCDGSKLYSYVDGVLLYTDNAVGGSLNGNFYIGTANKYLGCMNDLRIYDHCLSPKEVKELSKGLCLHYTLNNGGLGCPNLATNTYNNTSWSWSMQAGDYTKTYEEDAGGKWCVLTKGTATAQSGWSVLQWPYIGRSEYVANTKYTVSFEVIPSHNCTLSIRLLKSNGTDYLTDTKSQAVVANKVNKVEVTLTTVATLPTSTDQIIYITGHNSSNGAIYKFRKVKIEKGEKATAWCPNKADAQYETFAPTVEYDTSGYRNNATPIDSTITHLYGSPRYDVYTKFDGNTSGLKIENTAQISPVLNNGIFTISFWVKHDVSSNREIYFGNFDASADFNLERTAGNDLRFYWNASPDLAMSGTTISDANWHHVVVTRNGSAVKCYIDGVSKYSGTATIASLTFDGSFRLGRDTRTGTTAFGGGMSDFRLYATALSEADIKELYNAPAAVDNDGNMYAMQLVEVI